LPAGGAARDAGDEVTDVTRSIHESGYRTAKYRRKRRSWYTPDAVRHASIGLAWQSWLMPSSSLTGHVTGGGQTVTADAELLRIASMPHVATHFPGRSSTN